MHGIGNDFILIDNRDGKIGDAEAATLAQELCERRFSVGADGILFLSNSALADFTMRLFNADGSEAEMCGNGIRCIAKYCYESNISQKKELTIETLAGIKRTWLNVEDQTVKLVRVDMGEPVFDRYSLTQNDQVCLDEELQIEGSNYRLTCLSMGNPHCVVFVDNVKDFPVDKVGPKIENNERFPRKTNVEFAQILNPNEARVRVWERGCGETWACGTGACAAVAAGNELKKLGDDVTVHLLGGDLRVEYNKRLFMTGPAVKVFEGKLF
jgi:diaminopimelate epimerase